MHLHASIQLHNKLVRFFLKLAKWEAHYGYDIIIIGDHGPSAPVATPMMLMAVA